MKIMNKMSLKCLIRTPWKKEKCWGEIINLIITRILGYHQKVKVEKQANRSKDPVGIANYKKQRNLVVSLNSQAKSEYFNKVSNTESSRAFRETSKPYFSNKHTSGDSKIMLIENDKMLLNNEEIAKEFNQYFGHNTDSLDLYEFPDVSEVSAKDCMILITYYSL